eukprot:996290_1
MILYTTIILPSEYTCSYEGSKNKSFRLKFCTDTGLSLFDVEKLWVLTNDNVIFQRDIGSFSRREWKISRPYLYIDNKKLSLQQVMQGRDSNSYKFRCQCDRTYRRAMACDISYPIILGPRGDIVDGQHRLAKIIILGAQKTARCVRATSDQMRAARNPDAVPIISPRARTPNCTSSSWWRNNLRPCARSLPDETSQRFGTPRHKHPTRFGSTPKRLITPQPSPRTKPFDRHSTASAPVSPGLRPITPISPRSAELPLSIPNTQNENMVQNCFPSRTSAGLANLDSSWDVTEDFVPAENKDIFSSTEIHSDSGGARDTSLGLPSRSVSRTKHPKRRHKNDG